MSFVHLHTHSEYSLLDGVAKPRALLEHAKEAGMNAMALTDHGYMFGAVDFYRAAIDVGVKPVLGCEVYFDPNSRKSREGKPNLYHLILLARTMEGYCNLISLCSHAAIGGFYYKPRVDLELLQRFSKGLIGTSACMTGIVSKSFERGEDETAREWAERYASVFEPDSFYLEIQNQGIVTDAGVTQERLCAQITDLGRTLGLPLIATNDVHYLRQEDAGTQDLLLAIGTGTTLNDPNRMRMSVEDFYCKTPEEMHAVHAATPEALSNTVDIAARCNVELEFDKIILPVFEVPQGKTQEEHLHDECLAGLKERYGDPIPPQVMERFEEEYGIITSKGISAYFLIVADFTQWAKRQGIGVGPGRGSAAGSIVSYALSITDLCPLENGLLFERFLNPERTEMPDIDMDFDNRDRAKVIDYVRQTYGDDRVAQIVTFDRLKAKQSVRDVGRIMDYAYNVPDRIAQKLMLQELNATIAGSLKGNPDYRKAYQEEADIRRITDEALKIEGTIRGEGVHAAAVVIAPDRVSKFLPAKLDTKEGGVITQYDGPTVAALGLLKMDFLGLRNLSVIQEALKNIEVNYDVKIEERDIPLDDTATFELLSRGDTAGVFQVESQGMRALLKRLKPTSFADIVAVLALYRPGPLGSGMVDDFVDRKAGKKPVTYYDERLKHILEETYGTFVYQEQVMRVSMEMAGFSAAKADKLRKGMGKRIREILDDLHGDWVEGAAANGYDPHLAEKMWQDILPFAEYAFNKSHSASYGVITMRTAYLKAHYPTETMAAVLSSYMGATKKLIKYIDECRKSGIEVLQPDINTSTGEFTAVPDVGIRFGLLGIRGIGEGVVEHILEQRSAGGPFVSLQDFINRVDLHIVGVALIEYLIKAGAFDSTGYPRRQLYTWLTEGGVFNAAYQRQKDRDAGQISMFELLDDDDAGDPMPEPEPCDWDKRMRLAFEKELIGVFASDHPLREIEDQLAASADYSLGELEDATGDVRGWFAGMIVKVDIRPTKRGAMMAILTLEDLSGSVECIVFPRTLEQYRDIIAEEATVRVRGRYETDDRGAKILVEEIETFDSGVFGKPPKRLRLKVVPEQVQNPEFSRKIQEMLNAFPGRDSVELAIYEARTDRTTVAIMKEKVDADNTGLFGELAMLLGEGGYEVK